MKRLGYTRYVAQGGDWGAPITSAMARQAPAGLLGIHINLPATVPPEVAAALAGGPAPAGLSDKERAVFECAQDVRQEGERGVRRDDGRAAADDRLRHDGFPGGLAAWILVHPGFAQWTTARSRRSPTRDDVLDDITLYWLTNTAASAARLYWENAGESLIVAAAQKTTEISMPVAITVFPDEVYRAPETWARRAYRNLIYFHEVDRGGHFAAWEQPELFAAELRAAFKSLRPRTDRLRKREGGSHENEPDCARWRWIAEAPGCREYGARAAARNQAHRPAAARPHRFRTRSRPGACRFRPGRTHPLRTPIPVKRSRTSSKARWSTRSRASPRCL